MALPPVGVGTALAAFAPFLEYFRPTRSPYLLVVLFGLGGLIAASWMFQSELSLRFEYFLLAIPIVVVLTVLTLFVFFHTTTASADLTSEQIDEQLKFSRSICISTGILCLVIGCWRAATEPLENWIFNLHYIFCIIQIVAFVVYSAARLRYEEPSTSLNHFQIALVTASFLVAATICMSLIKASGLGGASYNGTFDIIANDSHRACTSSNWTVTNDRNYCTFDNLLSLSAIVCYSLWGWCQVYWVKRLTKIIKISVSPPHGPQV